MPGPAIVPGSTPDADAGAERKAGAQSANSVNLAINANLGSLVNANRVDTSRLGEQLVTSTLLPAQLGNLNAPVGANSSEAQKSPERKEEPVTIPAGIVLPSQSITLDRMVRDTGFQTTLERVRDDVMQVAALDRNVVASSIGVSASFTIGYVLWLLRGGVLISSLLASLPAWRMVDPLPVLGSLANSKRAHKDDKSLEELVEHK